MTYGDDTEKDAPGRHPEAEQTMESLLAEQADLQSKVQSRDLVWVKVVQVREGQVLVDIGEKSEAVIPASEFLEEVPAPGKRVPAILVKRGRGDEPTTLSVEKARARLGWEQAERSFTEKARVRGKVLSAVKGGFLVDVGGVRAFMPASLADLRPVRNPKALVGTGVRAYILEMNKDKGQMVISRRAVLEEDAQKRKSKLLEEIKAGQVRIGRVNRIGENGLFVDIGGLEGLVQVEDVAWKDPEAAKAKFERGQKVRAKVLKVDGEQVALGLKQLLPHPGDSVRKKYPVKAVVKGTVSEILKDEGVRIALQKGETAFCPMRELPTEGGDPTKARPERGEFLPPIWPKEGEAVTGIVLGVHPKTFEPTVSIRRYEAAQDRKRVAKYLKGAPPLTLGQLLGGGGEEE